ncbi:hypothetical protein ETAA1_09120 [Urbifossiella limnaea]|uniref:Uncharacterized protein n=1 Tax=Urbifossiella limnaea TaxID=2528023 RepID=A0A517XNC6_9BACT|nr:hypothetical protein ETAA1_09120 [Urbifossiella limnaea]
MLPAELVGQSDDDFRNVSRLRFRRLSLRAGRGLRGDRRRRHRLARHRERRDDPVPQLGPLEILGQIPPDAGAERDAVAGHQTVVHDPALEGQQDRLRQDRQVGADQVLERLRQGQDAVGDGLPLGREEHRVLRQFPEDVELARHEMPPGADDGEVVLRQPGRVLGGEGLDQADVGEEGVTDLEPDFRGHGGELFRGCRACRGSPGGAGSRRTSASGAAGRTVRHPGVRGAWRSPIRKRCDLGHVTFLISLVAFLGSKALGSNGPAIPASPRAARAWGHRGGGEPACWSG